MKSPIHLVIRTVGERTLEQCKRFAQLALPEKSSISVVCLSPFEDALRKSYELGIEAGFKWTMTLDADVLLLPNSIDQLIGEAELMPEEFFQLEGRIFDKIIGRYRSAGHRIYRTSLLPKALSIIPAKGDQIRPEWYTILEMSKSGYPYRCSPIVVGIHDFFQSYADLYRKAFIHAKKSSNSYDAIIERCLAYKEADDDFKVILKGFCDGLQTEENVSINKERLDQLLKPNLDTLGLKEKDKSCVIDDLNCCDVIKSKMEGIAEELGNVDIKRQKSIRVESRMTLIVSAFKEKGFVRGMRFVVGSVFCKFGTKLIR